MAPAASEPEITMNATTVSPQTAFGLPQALRTAQAAMLLPDVQDRLRKLSGYNLGIFMPYMHADQTGEFQPLPEDLELVESGLEVSFQPAADITSRKGRFLPVGWYWRADAPGTVTRTATVTACELARQEDNGETTMKHKMLL